MNKEYTYINGKVIVENENRERRVIDYYDNLENVLRQENLIEVIEQEQNQIENDLKEDSEITASDIYLPFLTLSTAPLVVSPIIARLFERLGDFNYHNIETKFGQMDLGVFVGILISSFTGVIGLTSSIFNYYSQKKQIKVHYAQMAQLAFIKEALIKEKERLLKLKEEMNREKENKDFRVVNLDEEEDLDVKIFYECLELSFNLVYYAKKYQKGYERGNLESILEKQGYNENGINAVKHYLDEVYPILSKKR